MRFKTYSLLLFVAFLAIDGINGKRFGGSGRSYGSSRSSHSGRSSTSNSYKVHSTNSGSVSRNKPVSTGHTSTVNHKPIGFETPAGRTSAPRPIEHPSAPVTPLQNKNTNFDFLKHEGGGAPKPTQPKPAQTPSKNWDPNGAGPGLATDRRQTSPPDSPYVPKDHIIRPSTGPHVNQGNGVPYPPGPGQANPPWSNPYISGNQPAVLSQPQPSSINPHGGGNQPIRPGFQPPPYGFKDHVYPQAHPASPGPQFGQPHTGGHPSYPQNPHGGGNQPIRPGFQPPPYGFKDHVYPQAHPASPGPQFGQPHTGGHPSYPQHAAPSAPSFPAPVHQPSAMPFGNPYSLHPPGNAYNAPGQAYYPQQSHVLAQPAMQPFVPGQTIVMMPGQQDSGRGFGQMVKEALVFSTINAGVNRVLNPHTHQYVESRPAESVPGSTTHVTYNNHYFNSPPGNGPTDNSTGTYPQNTGTYAPSAGTGPVPATTNTDTVDNTLSSRISVDQLAKITADLSETSSKISEIINRTSPSVPTRTPNNGVSSPSGIGSVVTPTTQLNVSNNQGNSTTNPNTVDNTLFYRISDDELAKITEDLFAKSPNISKYIKLNLQNRTTSPNVTDGAKYPLFEIEPELLDFPSISVTRTLYNSYEHDYRKKLNRTLEIREHENLLIDTFLNTNVMATTMQWLADRGFIDPDDFERKDVIRRVWFTMFSGSSCGFERVFASENYGTDLIGVQDWIYFENQETLKRIDYMGYADKLNLGSTSSLLKLNFQMDGIIRPNATIFVGTMPELEMSLYTICFYARQNNACPVSLGGTKFHIYTHAFTYFGNDIIDLAFPLF